MFQLWISDPAHNTCPDPGTPQFGIQNSSRGYEVLHFYFTMFFSTLKGNWYLNICVFLCTVFDSSYICPNKIHSERMSACYFNCQHWDNCMYFIYTVLTAVLISIWKQAYFFIFCLLNWHSKSQSRVTCHWRATNKKTPFGDLIE